MSTLTKVLIILHSAFSILLCGIVVTYVANANKYKGLYEDARTTSTRAEQKVTAIQELFDQEKAANATAAAASTEKVGDLERQISVLKGELEAVKQAKAQTQQRHDALAAELQASSASIQQQTKLFNEAKTQLEQTRIEQVKLNQQFKEAQDAVVEKAALIATQDEKIRALTEEKTQLESQLDQVLRQYGKAPGSGPKPGPDSKKPQNGTVPDLKGVVTEVDLTNKLAEISIGSAAGVRTEMAFHVTRGDQFICNILITDVDQEKSVGILDLVQQTPVAGDKAGTQY